MLGGNRTIAHKSLRRFNGYAGIFGHGIGREIPLHPIPQRMQMADYLKKLVARQSELTLVICSRDNIGTALTGTIASLLRELGVSRDLTKEALKGCSHRGFIFVAENGVPQIELVSEEWLGTEYRSEDYDIVSRTWQNGACAASHVRLPRVAPGFNFIDGARRGLHFVVLNAKGNLVDSRSFDTHQPDFPATKAATRKQLNEHRQTLARYAAFCASADNGTALPELNLTLPQYPYGETAIVMGALPPEMPGFRSTELPGKGSPVHILSTLPFCQTPAGVSYIFGGHIISPERFFWGHEDIPADFDIVAQRDSCGEFDLLYHDADGIVLGGDFFGFGKWFHYRRDGLFAAATSYHLLLEILADLGEQLQLNQDRVLASAGTLSWLSEQQFSPEMEVRDIFLLDPDRRLILRWDGSVELETTRLHQETHSPRPWDGRLYDELLNRATEELTASLTRILEHPGFENFIIDLTDGLDTRNCLAIALNLPQHLQAKIACYSIPRLKADFKTANGIKNMFGLRWEAFPRTQTVIPQSAGIDQSAISVELGTYFAEVQQPSVEQTTIPGTLRLTGGNGESCTALAAQLDLLMYADTPVADYPATIRERQLQPVFDSRRPADAFLDLLQSGLAGLPATENAARLGDAFYLRYRNRLHFKRKYRPGSLNPIQSQAAYTAKMMSFTRGVSFAFQHDLISRLHPLLAAFPYVEPKQTRRVELLQARGLNGLPAVKVDITPDYTEQPLPTPAMESLRNDADSMQSPVDCQPKQALYDWVYGSEDALLSCLKTILRTMPAFERIGLDYFLFIHRQGMAWNSSYPHVRTIFTNKLLSLYYQIKAARISLAHSPDQQP